MDRQQFKDILDSITVPEGYDDYSTNQKSGNTKKNGD